MRIFDHCRPGGGVDRVDRRAVTRIEQACTLMRSTPALALSDIAAECGFSDQAHFNRVFNRLRGLSPGRWRRLHAESACTSVPAAVRQI